MTDITKCDGDGCALRERCYRFTAPAGMIQSYFAEAPFRLLDDGVSCDYFDPFQPLKSQGDGKEYATADRPASKRNPGWTF